MLETQIFDPFIIAFCIKCKVGRGLFRTSAHIDPIFSVPSVEETAFSPWIDFDLLL